MTAALPRVLVVGAGIAGIACARVLHDAGLDVTVRDRGHSVGGRMASQALGGRADGQGIGGQRDGGQRGGGQRGGGPGHSGRTADTGAQYATATGDAFSALMRDWVTRGVARAWATGFHAYADGELRPPQEGAQRWSAPGGMRSLVVDLADGLPIELESTVSHVGPGPTADGESFDAVVLAMPDPQAYRLLDPALGVERELIGDREWEAVLAIQARWSARDWDVDGVFVNGDDTLAWIADDGARRGDGAAVLVGHSTGAYAAGRLEDPAASLPELVTGVRAVLGVGEPEAARVQRWTYARPTAARTEPFHLGPARIGICGDGWGSAKVETAWVSGTALGHAVEAALR